MSSDQIAPVFLPAVTHFDEALRGLRTGRATPALVEHVRVTAYGSPQRLKELATITVPDAATIQIEPWDTALVPAVVKALQASPLGLQPSETGSVIRLALPPLSTERRQEITKVIHQRVEEAKVTIRTTREKLFKDLRARKERGELSEDAWKREQKRLQADVLVVTAAVEARAQDKEAEIINRGPIAAP